MASYIGIDYGTKKIGIAVSDEDGAIAFPLAVVPNDRDAAGYIGQLSQERRAAAVVIGESRDFTGAPNPVFERARAFAASLEEGISAPVVFEPEFFSTQEAEHMRSDEQAGPPDASAAAVILQSFLDKRRDTNA